MMRTRTKILLALAAAVAALAAVLLVNVWLLPPLPAPGVQTHAPRQATFDAAAAAGRLSAALRVPTVSSEQAGAPPADFPAMHRLLEQQFPLVHAHLEREIVGGASLLYTWHGTAPELEPVLLTAHMDVVPVAADTLGKWRYPPFAGMVADGYIWGRGAMDMKG
ncbi:MAG TPA: M20/M25/M40 family metallo-hydrolase, partial [Burkholderiaceae bacterium]